MKGRIASAAEKKCDAVDPDNMGKKTIFHQALESWLEFPSIHEIGIGLFSHKS